MRDSSGGTVFSLLKNAIFSVLMYVEASWQLNPLLIDNKMLTMYSGTLDCEHNSFHKRPVIQNTFKFQMIRFAIQNQTKTICIFY